MKLISLFSGIGAFEKALANLNIDHEVINYCEFDKYASESYSAIHGIDKRLNLGDITKVDISKLEKGSADLITYGFPCQDISLAGKQKGFEDENGNLTRSGLFFYAASIIGRIQPRIAVCENVKALVGKKFEKEFKIVLDTLDKMGYNNYWQVLNAKDYGIPQNRERVFVVSVRKDIDNGEFNFPKPFNLERKVADILESKVDEKYYLSDRVINYFIKCNGTDIVEPVIYDDYNGRIKADQSVIGTLTTNCGNDAERNGVKIIEYSEYSLKKIKANIVKGDIVGTITANAMQSVNHDNCHLIQNNYRIRKLTPKECWRLMGFDDKDIEKAQAVGISNTQLYKQAGNSIVVNVLMEIFKQLHNCQMI